MQRDGKSRILPAKSKHLKGKVVIVTGASSGIGEALALRYAHAGAKVVLVARNTEKLKEVEDAIQKQGGQCHSIKADVSVRMDCENMVSQTIAHFGKIDVLINNAGISMRALLRDADPEVIEQVMKVNFNGTLYCTKFALPHILASKGAIIGISSIAGFRGLPGRSGYCASKFAMHGFLESLRTELLKTGVHVMLACPGFTASNIRNVALGADGNTQKENPLNEQQLMPANEVADLIFKAHMRKKRSIVMTRQGKLTVFMNKWWPSFMDKQVWKHYSKEPGLNL
jgi:dehydrogenase/reductase SDR family protein 7B